MKLGAQLFSIRDRCDTPEKLKEAFSEIKKIGYSYVQASAICDIEGERLRSYVEEFDLPIGCTHRSFQEITEKTDECIAFHKAIGCNVIGLGWISEEYRGTYENLKKLHNALSEPLKKIKAAGLSFAYHNHAFEFDDVGGTTIYDYLISELPELDFIHDVYWSTYAGKDPADYIKLLAGAGRMSHIHFKDMKELPTGVICACGDGVIDFKKLYALCSDYGIKNIYVEQDNAPDSGDSIKEMARSYDYLNTLLKG